MGAALAQDKDPPRWTSKWDNAILAAAAKRQNRDEVMARLRNTADIELADKDRLLQFAKAIDETGSFAIYNSPSYAYATITDLTRIRMFVKDDSIRKLARRIEERLWLHLAEHWHAPTLQLAGPMCRCDETDIGKPAWIQKALGGAIPFYTLDDIRREQVPMEVALFDYNCPDSASGWFLGFGIRAFTPSCLPMLRKASDPCRGRLSTARNSAWEPSIEATLRRRVVDHCWRIGAVPTGPPALCEPAC